MSSDARWVVEMIPSGNGIALDLGGGQGLLRTAVESKGYRYINLDIRRFANGEPTVLGSAHDLPFRDSVFDLVISKDSLEHFLEPWRAVREVHRVLKPGGLFIVWVPFVHPFRGDDTYRYTHLGLKHLLREFDILTLEAPLWVFSLLGLILTSPLSRLRLFWLASLVRRTCERLDGFFTRQSPRPRSWTVAYRVVARKVRG